MDALSLEVPSPAKLRIEVLSHGGEEGGAIRPDDITLRAVCLEPHTQTVLLGAPLRSSAISKPRSTIALEIICAPP